MLRNQEKKNEIKKGYELHTSDNFFKKPVVKIIIGASVVFGALYISKYFINSAAEAVRACKNFRDAVRE